MVNKIQQNKIDIENLKFEADRAEREGDYEKVAEIRYAKITAKEQEIKDVQEKLKTLQGGVAMIKAMAAPYVGIKFMPTGGINAKNLENYLSFDKIICCGGSWMVKGELVNNGEFDKIRELTAEARKLVDSIRK